MCDARLLTSCCDWYNEKTNYSYVSNDLVNMTKMYDAGKTQGSNVSYFKIPLSYTESLWDRSCLKPIYMIVKRLSCFYNVSKIYKKMIIVDKQANNPIFFILENSVLSN